jgi:phosphotriesterase-related protein
MIPAGSVRTVLGDIDASDLGVTFMHEHLIIDSPTVATQWPHIHLPNAEDATRELESCAAADVGSMVDAMPMASGRGPKRLAAASALSGVNIVMATGLHTDKYYESMPWVADASSEQLASWFIADIEDGVDASDHLMDDEIERTDHRAGITKVATSHDGMDARAQRLFAAAAQAAVSTGAPILTHCEDGVGGMEQVAAFQRLGVPLERVVLSHTDKVGDQGYHTALLESGANLEFDQALRQVDGASSGTARLLHTQIERGFVDQLMLGTDGARRSLWATLGGTPGLAWMATGYRAIMADVGIPRAEQAKLFVTNPARFLAGSDRDPAPLVNDQPSTLKAEG